MTQTPNREENRVGEMLGCGLGIYTVLLAMICLLGLVGIVVSTMGILQIGSGGSSEIQPGHELQVYQLSAMRRAGVVEVEELPNVFHDESPMRDGSTACALMVDRLVRVESEGEGPGWSCQGESQYLEGWQMTYDDIQSVESTGDHYSDMEIIVTGLDADGEPLEIRCKFGEEEGGMRIKRQLQVESGLVEDF